MASDGLLFQIFSKVDSKTKTPFWGTFICGAFAGKYEYKQNVPIHKNNIDVCDLLYYHIILVFHNNQNEIPKHSNNFLPIFQTF